VRLEREGAVERHQRARQLAESPGGVAGLMPDQAQVRLLLGGLVERLEPLAVPPEFHQGSAPESSPDRGHAGMQRGLLGEAQRLVVPCCRTQQREIFHIRRRQFRVRG
jgi:hypothetical protein